METINEISRQGLRFYIERLKGRFEPEHIGRYIAIEPGSEKYFLGDTGTEALVAAHKAMPDARFYLMRIGHSMAHNIRG